MNDIDKEMWSSSVFLFTLGLEVSELRNLNNLEDALKDEYGEYIHKIENKCIVQTFTRKEAERLQKISQL